MSKPVLQIVLLAVLGLIVVVGIVMLVILLRRRKPVRQGGESESRGSAADASAVAADSRSIKSAFRDAQHILDNSAKLKGSTIAALPAFIVIGPKGAGRTSLIQLSRIELTLLAGKVHSGSEIAPTSGINIWLSGDNLLVEVSADTSQNPAAMQAVLKELSPGKVSSIFGKPLAPRAAVLCVDQVILAAAKTEDEVAALARPWQDCLQSVSGQFGTQLPVYAVFTKTDAVGGFAEFCSNLGATDLDQAFGATVRPFDAASGGAYGEEMSRRLSLEFAGIYSSLCDSRIPVLNREQDRAKIPAQYQFPREFQKLQKNITRFLVEIVRPSPLQVSPFLRGFYFTGTRRVAVDRAEARDIPLAHHPSPFGATSVMSLEQMRAQASQSPMFDQRSESAEITEWLFSQPLLERVIKADRPAQGATDTSSRTDRLRAIMGAVVSGFMLILLTGMTVSFIRNRSLEKELVSAAAKIQDARGGGGITAISVLQTPVANLLKYRETSPPPSMRWGLYSGDSLLPGARTAYCSAMAGVLRNMLERMQDRLAALKTATVGNPRDFRNLKAYMMMTTNPEKAESSFLGQELFELWSEKQDPGAAANTAGVLESEFETYGKLLSLPGTDSACVFQPKPALIPASQAYLRALNANDLYQSLLQQSGAGASPVKFGALFPNPAVSDPKIVPGWFTQRGWTQMQQKLDHPGDSLKADAWVLGESKELTPEQLATVAREYRVRYYNEYVAAWRDFLSSARVNSYNDLLQEAAAKLEIISGDRSPLLSLIGLATENTASIDKVKTVFQSTKAVVPAQGDFQPDAEYLKQLGLLKNRLVKAAESTGPAHDQDIQEVRNAVTTAQDSVDQIARAPGFRSETDQLVKNILLMPLLPVPKMLSRQNIEALNAGGTELCTSWKAITHFQPFAPSAQQGAPIDDVQKLLQPEKGRIWQFYNDQLRDSLDCQGFDCKPRPNPKFNLTIEFLDYYRTMNAWSRLLYGGSPDPVLRLRAKATGLNHVKQVEVLMDDQKVTLLADAEYQTLSWDLRKLQKLAVSGSFEGEPQLQELFRTDGHWAIFEWLYNAEKGSGGSEGFTWLPRSGTIKPQLLNNGNNKRYKLEIRVADGSERPLDLHQLARTTCPATVAR